MTGYNNSNSPSEVGLIVSQRVLPVGLIRARGRAVGSNALGVTFGSAMTFRTVSTNAMLSALRLGESIGVLDTLSRLPIGAPSLTANELAPS